MGILARTKLVALAAAVVIGAASAAQAGTINAVFSLGGSSFSEPGLVMDTSARSGSVALNLSVGQSVTFDLFDIWATEASATGNNTQASSLIATFGIAGTSANATAAGTTRGFNAFFVHFASLGWGGPVLLNFGGTGILSITLTDAVYGFGFFGLGQGPANGATIRATATLISAAVPLPASGLALGSAIMLAAAGLRRRKHLA